jgi:hypothetical protein
MRSSTPGSLWLRPKAAKRKESTKKGARRKGETKFVEESGRLILSSRITKVLSKEIVACSKMKSTAISLAVWNL